MILKKVHALGNGAKIIAYIDANHAGRFKTRRLYNEILIYTKQSPIIQYSKGQNTVEILNFGSECIALRICTETVNNYILYGDSE